jgi:hypothetical protein
MTIELNGEDVQMLLLAMAKLSAERPGWDCYMTQVAEKLSGPRGSQLYREFQKIHNIEGGKSVSKDGGKNNDQT